MDSTMTTTTTNPTTTTRPDAQFVLEPRGAFTLATIREFQCGLMIASRSCDAGDGAVRLAFPADGTHRPVGVRLREQQGVVEVSVFGSRDADAVGRQVARILSLDHDGRPYDRLLERDPVLRAVSARRPGFRPPVFYSPYAAAGWLVLAPRTTRAQAARVQQTLAREAGDVVVVDGVPVASFPRPEAFLSRSRFAGVSDEKWRRLQAVARAALAGELAIDRLRAMPYLEAIAALRRVHGIGAWTAEGVLMRGCGLADALCLAEPRARQAVQIAYGLDRAPSDAQLATLADGWRPYRAWVTVLLTAAYYDVTGGPAAASARRGRGRVREEPKGSVAYEV